MNDTSHIIFALIFGALGLGFFTYGRRQRAVVPFVTGIALFIVPYLFANLYILLIIGIALVMLPFFTGV